MRGLEPPRVAPHDPKSCASASSATSALFFNNLKGQLKIGINFDSFFTFLGDFFSPKIYYPKCDFKRNKVYFEKGNYKTKK